MILNDFRYFLVDLGLLGDLGRFGWFGVVLVGRRVLFALSTTLTQRALDVIQYGFVLFQGLNSDTSLID